MSPSHLKVTFLKDFLELFRTQLFCASGVRAAPGRARGASGEFQLEVGHGRRADDVQGGAQQQQQRGRAEKVREEGSQHLKFPIHNRDSPGGGGLPHHQLLPDLLQWGAGRDGDLEHRCCPEAQKSMWCLVLFSLRSISWPIW